MQYLGSNMRRRAVVTLGAALTAATFAWGAAVTWIWAKQESLLFHPEPLASDYQFKVPQTTEEWVPVDGGRLSALHLRQPSGVQTKGLVFFLHGNAGNLATWFTKADFWLSTGYDVFMLDYRGFGKSSGEIQNQAQLNRDVLAAWNQVAPAYQGRKLVIYGRSLGTGLAAELAKTQRCDLLVLVSPYKSMQALALEHYSWVPNFVLRYPLRTDLALPETQASRVWIAHGEQDTLIPIEHAKALRAISPAATLLTIPNAVHENVQTFSAYTDGLKQVLSEL